MGLRPIAVEQGPEQQRAEEIAGRERQQIPADAIRGDAVEVGQDQRVGEEDRVVKERLGGHQTEADQRSLAIGLKQRAQHFDQRRMAAYAQTHARDISNVNAVARGGEIGPRYRRRRPGRGRDSRGSSASAGFRESTAA